ncbi:hypothetical protein [Raineyella sp. W15-4]|uniref:hypothetical protein n=1 Tax=Raineyella sp. W15-4 TaxID=3081651 RepID=UPI0029535C46|nr:hypothetical protein [Raineyella sp. W15-4]WOQ17849.1 hypothetical protein R0145_03840 [Raineyella sp. W15-4]
MLSILEQSGPVSAPDVAAIIEATQPIGVRVDEVHAGPVRTIPTTMTAGIVECQSAYALLPDDDVLLVRIAHTLSCREDDDEVASIRVAHIVSFKVTADLETSRPAMSAWVDTNAYFLAYPYVRQFFTEITAALGLPPVVLDYRRRDDWPTDAPAGGQSSPGTAKPQIP